MSTAVATNLDIIEKLVVEGDLSKLSQEERLRYYHAMCERLGLDSMSQPLSYLRLNSKLVLYVGKGATDQIAANRGISRRIVKTDILPGNVYIVIAEASDRSGRVEQSSGAISIEGMRGENLVNALLKAETKAKRRAVLSFTGAGMLDETEAESIPGAVRIEADLPRQLNPHQADPATGEIDESAPAPANWVQRLHRRNAEIIERFGHDEAIPVPAKVTRGDAEQIGALQTKILGVVEVPA